MFSSKNQDNSLEAHVHSPYIPHYPMHKHNIWDITKWHHNHLLPSFGGQSTAHVQERHNGLPVHSPVSSLTVSYSFIWTISSILYPKLGACFIYIYIYILELVFIAFFMVFMKILRLLLLTNSFDGCMMTILHAVCHAACRSFQISLK